MHQVSRQVIGEVGQVAGLDGPSGQLQQGGGVVSHVLDEADHQGVAAETELLQAHQAEDLPGQVGQQVVMETEGTQGVEPEGREMAWSSLL